MGAWVRVYDEILNNNGRSHRSIQVFRVQGSGIVGFVFFQVRASASRLP